MGHVDATNTANEVYRLEGYGDFTDPSNANGLPLNFIELGDVVGGRFSVPRYMAGWRGVEFDAAHPGIVDVVLSTVMGHAAFNFVKEPLYIRSISAEYLDFVPVETELQCEARLVGQREDEVLMDSRIFDVDGRLLARASGTFRIVSFRAMRAKSTESVAGMSPALRCGGENLDIVEAAIRR